MAMSKYVRDVIALRENVLIRLLSINNENTSLVSSYIPHIRQNQRRSTRSAILSIKRFWWTARAFSSQSHRSRAAHERERAWVRYQRAYSLSEVRVHIPSEGMRPLADLALPRKSLGEQRTNSCSQPREGNIVSSSSCFSSSGSAWIISRGRECTDTRDPRAHVHARASSTILRAFIDHCVPAGVNPEPYLVSWLADSRIFPIPFHQAGVKGRL